MAGINVGRWLAGGIVAAIVIFIIEGLGSQLYAEELQAALAAHGITLEMNAEMLLLAALISLLMGLTLVFFYAAARTRFGPGVRTAVIVSVALYLGSYLPGLLGYQMLGLYPAGLLVGWAVQGLVEMVLAGIAGAWVYREGASASRIAGATTG